MANIVTWEFYSSLYNNITEEEFPAAEALAEQITRTEIGLIRWANITEDTFGYIALQECICNLINKMHEDGKLGLGKGVQSVNNDGYSETFAVTTESEQYNELRKMVRIWLSGTGLIGAY